MSIRNATIARRRRKIGLSEQERMMLDAALRRASRMRQSKAQEENHRPLQQDDKAAHWHASWAE